MKTKKTLLLAVSSFRLEALMKHEDDPSTHRAVRSSWPRANTHFDSRSENRGMHEYGSLVKTNSAIDRKEYSPEVGMKHQC